MMSPRVSALLLSVWTIALLGSLLGSLSLAIPGYGGIDPALTRFEVIPAYAPVSDFSPSFSAYTTNVIDYLRGQGTAAPTRNSPADYELAPTSESSILLDPREALITGGFNSWRGYADPTVGWAGDADQFAMEQGNRIHFGVAIETVPAVKISLNDLSFQRYWLDADDLSASDIMDNPLTSGNVATPSNPNYTPSRVGLLYGADGQLGGGDDMLITSGPGSQLVDAIYYIGVGDAFVAAHPEAPDGQSNINWTLSDLTANGSSRTVNQVLGVTYKLALDGRDVTQTDSVTFQVPEPSGLVLASITLLFVVTRMRRRLPV